MPSFLCPYTVTNSYKGGLFMRTYGRNVRKTWDEDTYRPAKRQRVDYGHGASGPAEGLINDENAADFLDYEDNLERAIRETSVAALSSSPSRKNSTIFSLESQEDEHVSHAVTPPSSPPPLLQITPPNNRPRKPTFSFLDKNKKEKRDAKSAKRKQDINITDASNVSVRREEDQPISDIHQPTPHTAVPTMNLEASPPNKQYDLIPPISTPKQYDVQPPPLKKNNLVQSVLDFGQSLNPITCPTCQMSYLPSVEEDQQLHHMFHNRHSTGIDLGKPFLKSAMKWCYEVNHIPGSVVVVDRKISVPGRKTVQRVLEVVNKELGSVDIIDEELWSQKPVDGEEEGKKSDRYKAFLHIIDGKCVGVCLAERISKLHKVIPTDESVGLRQTRRITPPATAEDKLAEDGRKKDANQTPKAHETGHPTPSTSTDGDTTPRATPPSSSISISNETYPAVVGVSRIWTSKAFRRKGIANNLLECVMNQFIYGMEIDRSEVAFSQPTESGANLARSWFGEDSGWGCYQEA